MCLNDTRLWERLLQERGHQGLQFWTDATAIKIDSHRELWGQDSRTTQFLNLRIRAHGSYKFLTNDLHDLLT